MIQYTTPSLIFVATGIVGSAWAAGASASSSLIAMASLKNIPHASSVQVWAEMFGRGIAIIPPTAVTASLAYAYVAFDTRGRGGNWKGFAAAAASAAAFVPFTLLFMGSTNEALHGAAAGTTLLSGAQVSDLLDKWSTLNLTRSSFLFIGTVTGLKALLDNIW